MSNLFKKPRSDAIKENRHNVKCEDCWLEFTSYSTTVEMALHYHKNVRKNCFPNKKEDNKNGGNKKRVVEDVNMDQDDDFGLDDIPDDFVDGTGECLWRRMERPPIAETEEGINDSSVRDASNTRNTRSLRAQQQEEELRDDGIEKADDEDENLQIELERQAKIVGARVANIRLDEDPPFCDFMSIVMKEKVHYLRINDYERRTKWIEPFVTQPYGIVDDSKTFQPSFAGIEFQRFLAAYYPNAKKYLRLNKVRGKEVDMDIALRFHRFITKTHLSSDEGEELFDLAFTTFASRFKEGEDYPMPQYRAVREKVNKNLHLVFPIVVTKIHLKEKFFGSDYKGRSLLYATGVNYLFLPKLFDYLLNDCNPLDFEENASQFSRGVPEFLEEGTRVLLYTNFMSGDLAARYDYTLKKKFGPRATGLYLAFYYDETTMNKSMSRTECPLYCYVLNASGKSFKPILVGMVPISLGYESDILEELLLKNTKGDGLKQPILDRVRQHSKRQMTRAFIFRVFQSILRYQETGIFGYVGRPGEHQKCCLFFIHMVSIFADTVGRDLIAGTNFRKDKSKCALCTTLDCKSCTVTESTRRGLTPRIDGLTNNYAKRSYEYLREEYFQRKNSTGQKWSRQGPTIYLSTVLEDLAYCHKHNILPGFNLLMLLFEWADNEGINSFYRSLRVDYLHVWLKGVINDCILDSVSVVATVGNYDKRWLDSGATLDRLLIEFQFIQTLHITRHIRWTRGVSLHRSTLDGATLTGGIEGWKLPSLLMQIMFSIACNTTQEVLPYGNSWYTQYIKDVRPMGPTSVMKDGNGESRERTHREVAEATKRIHDVEKNIDIREIVLSACASVMEVTFILRADRISSRYIEDYQQLMENCRSHCDSLRLLKRRLGGDFWTKTTAVKPHSTMHFVPQSKEVGHMRQGSDTTGGERGHIDVKKSFEATSKRTWGSTVGILTHKLRVERANRVFVELGETEDEVVDGVKILPNMRDPYQLNAQGGIPQDVVFVQLPNGELNLKASDCLYQCGDHACQLEEEHKEKHKPNYHPLLNPQRFRSILQGYGNKTEDKNEKRLINKALSNEASVQLWNQAKIKGNNDKGLQDFYIKATSIHNYNHNESEDRRKCQQYSFVMVDLDYEEPELCQVLSIVHIEGAVRSLDLLIVVSMDERNVPAPKARYSLPYKMYQYGRDKKDRSCLSCHAIPFNWVNSPAFVISGKNTSSLHKFVFNQWNTYYFYSIPFGRISGRDPIEYDTLQNDYPATFSTTWAINERSNVIDSYFG